MIFEICIAAHDFLDQGGWVQPLKEGDVVYVRPALGYVGAGELKDFIHLSVDITDKEVLGGIQEEEFEGGIVKPGGLKRRYNIPLTVLKSVMPSFDLAKARDPRMIYQPFCQLRESFQKWMLDSHQTIPFVAGVTKDRVKGGDRPVRDTR